MRVGSSGSSVQGAAAHTKLSATTDLCSVRALRAAAAAAAAAADDDDDVARLVPHVTVTSFYYGYYCCYYCRGTIFYTYIYVNTYV